MPRPYRVAILPAALDDLRRIHDFIARDSRGRAREFAKDIRGKILNLAKFPRRGAPCRFVGGPQFEELRVLSHRGYSVFYDLQGRDVLVLHIAGPGQDWTAFFA